MSYSYEDAKKDAKKYYPGDIKGIIESGQVYVDISDSLKQLGKYAFLLRVHDHIWRDKEFSWPVQFVSCYRVRLLALDFISENAYVKPRWPFYYGRYE